MKLAEANTILSAVYFIVASVALAEIAHGEWNRRRRVGGAEGSRTLPSVTRGFIVIVGSLRGGLSRVSEAQYSYLAKERPGTLFVLDMLPEILFCVLQMYIASVLLSLFVASKRVVRLRSSWNSCSRIEWVMTGVFSIAAFSTLFIAARVQSYPEASQYEYVVLITLFSVVGVHTLASGIALSGLIILKPRTQVIEGRLIPPNYPNGLYERKQKQRQRVLTITLVGFISVIGRITFYSVLKKLIYRRVVTNDISAGTLEDWWVAHLLISDATYLYLNLLLLPIPKAFVDSLKSKIFAELWRPR